MAELTRRPADDELRYYYVPADQRAKNLRKFNLIIRKRGKMGPSLNFFGSKFTVIARQEPQPGAEWEIMTEQKTILSYILPQNIGLLKPEAQAAWRLMDRIPQ